MTDRPDRGRLLITGASGTGKTRATARALREWVRTHGSREVAILEFGPEVSYEGRTIGRRLDQYVPLPPRAWRGVVDTHAPRIEGATPDAVRRLAAENARVAAAVIEGMPTDRRAVFVNDATIPFQHPTADPALLLDRLADVEYAVLNAYTGEEFGDAAIAEHEREVVARFRAWADREDVLG